MKNRFQDSSRFSTQCGFEFSFEPVDWEFVLDNGESLTRIANDGNESYDEYKAIEEVFNKKLDEITNVFTTSDKPTAIVEILHLPGNDINILFDNGIELIGKGRPHYVYPWKIHIDLLSWICDKGGLHCDIY